MGLTGQTELSSNSVPLIYDSPRISTTTIISGAGTNDVSISGNNFCSDNNCGELFVCEGVTTNSTVEGCGACFTGDIPRAGTNDPPQRLANPSNSALWSHTFARISTTRSGGCVYVRVGNSDSNYLYSNAVSFTTTNPLILQGGDLNDKTTSFITRSLAYPTSALDDADAPIRLKVLVANLQDPSISNTKIIIGPYGCAQELGTAAIVGAPEQTQNGHLITVLLPEGTGTDVQVKCCFYSLASAPAIIHYLPPIVTSVRHLPYSTSGIDNLDITTRAGGLPTGGAAYNGFVPSQLDAAIASASSKVGVANSAQMTASTIY